MNNYANAIISLEILCFETAKEPVDKVEAKLQEYIKNYPHLRNPASLDLLRMTVQLWFRIQATESELEKCDDPAQKRKISKDLDSMVPKWMRMIADLGLSWTKKQYLFKDSTKVVAPIERLKMLRGGQQ